MSTTQAMSFTQAKFTSQAMSATQAMSSTKAMSTTQAMSFTEAMSSKQAKSNSRAISTSSAQAMSSPLLDTASLSAKVRHYLKSNQIQLSRFSSLVLGVSQSRLSTLLAKPQTWHLLTRRVQALYQRMQLWMDTRATYGNNPFFKEKTVKHKQARMNKKIKTSVSKKPRSLFEMQDNMKLLKQVEDYTTAQGLVEESGAGSQDTDRVVVLEQEGFYEDVVEDGEVQVDMEMMIQDLVVMEQMADQNGEVSLGSQAVGEQKVGEGGNRVYIYQVEEQEVNQSDLAMCQVVVEDNPDQPGTFKLSFLSVAGDDETG